MSEVTFDSIFAEIEEHAKDIRIKELKENEDRKIAWRDSDLRWIKDISSPKQLSKILRSFLLKMIVKGNFQSIEEKTQSRKHIILINDINFQIKTSTIWQGEKKRHYKFQQIRKNNYEILICFGLSPYEAHCWVIKKDCIIDDDKEWIDDRTIGQHGKNSRWLIIDPDAVADWLQPLGGDLHEALAVLKEAILTSDSKHGMFT